MNSKITYITWLSSRKQYISKRLNLYKEMPDWFVLFVPTSHVYIPYTAHAKINVSLLQRIGNNSSWKTNVFFSLFVEDINESPSWCTTVTEDNVGELQFKTESCSLPRKYVCQIRKYNVHVVF